MTTPASIRTAADKLAAEINAANTGDGRGNRDIATAIINSLRKVNDAGEALLSGLAPSEAKRRHAHTRPVDAADDVDVPLDIDSEP